MTTTSNASWPTRGADSHGPLSQAASGHEPLLRVEGLTKEFVDRSGAGSQRVRAVRGVSLSIEPGEVYALVGESGSGKSTLARCVLRLIEPTSGDVWFLGMRLAALRGEGLRRIRREIGVVFQSPFASLDPRMRVREIVSEPLRAHLSSSREATDTRLEELLSQVGLNSSHLTRYPHQLSGGQQQRVAIARALSLSPRLLVLDEPTSALDVSVQAQVLNLLVDLRTKFGLSYLLISHDLAVVQHLADRTGVMYLGQLVEEGRSEEIFANPSHPYTRALLDAAPRLDRDPDSARVILRGDLPSPRAIPEGCSFHTRCWLYEKLGKPEVCLSVEPTPQELGKSHRAACHFSGRAMEGLA
jgi:peptide/nickel transport system ATP-binding protein